MTINKTRATPVYGLQGQASHVLMFEMSFGGEYHSDAVFVCGGVAGYTGENGLLRYQKAI
jgi:hypothetical protein